jgi:Flp pilus assembly protein TadD
VACIAIGVGVFTNHREEMSPLAPTLSEHVVTADVDPAREGWTEPQVVAAEEHADEVEAQEPAATGLESSDDVALEAAAATEETDEALVIEGDPLEAAREAFVNRDHATVIASLRGAASENDPRFDVHYLLGLALRYEGRADESVAAMDAALAIQPNSVRTLTNSARALLETRDLAQAEERVRRAVELAPEDTGAWNVLGRVHLTNGALAEAEDAFARVLEIQPEHAWALNNLGFARLQRGAWDEAAEVLERAILTRADVALFHNNLGVAYERLSRLSDAQRAYAEALTLQSDYAKAQVSLARVTDRIAEGAIDVAAGDAAPTVVANTNSVETSDETKVEAADASEKSESPESESSVQP